MQLPQIAEPWKQTCVHSDHLKSLITKNADRTGLKSALAYFIWFCFVCWFSCRFSSSRLLPMRSHCSVSTCTELSLAFRGSSWLNPWAEWRECYCCCTWNLWRNKRLTIFFPETSWRVPGPTQPHVQIIPDFFRVKRPVYEVCHCYSDPRLWMSGVIPHCRPCMTSWCGWGLYVYLLRIKR